MFHQSIPRGYTDKSRIYELDARRNAVVDRIANHSRFDTWYLILIKHGYPPAMEHRPCCQFYSSTFLPPLTRPSARHGLSAELYAAFTGASCHVNSFAIRCAPSQGYNNLKTADLPYMSASTTYTNMNSIVSTKNPIVSTDVMQKC